MAVVSDDGVCLLQALLEVDIMNDRETLGDVLCHLHYLFVVISGYEQRSSSIIL